MSRLDEIRGRVERDPGWWGDDVRWLLEQVATLTAERDALESERDAALLRAES